VAVETAHHQGQLVVSFSPARAIALGIAFVSAGLLARNIVEQANVFLHDLWQTRAVLNSDAVQPSRRAMLKRMLEGTPLRTWTEPLALSPARVRRSERASQYELIATLFELSAVARGSKSESLVYLPKANALFWADTMVQPSIGAIAGGCMIAPFYVPSITGMAFIRGLPPPTCALQYYGYEHYPDGIRRRSEPVGERQLCDDASRFGLRRIVVIESGGSHDRLSRTIDCKA
jgi:hypothetical protein